MSESPQATTRIGWGGCGQLVSGCRRGIVSNTNPPTAYTSESAGEGVANWCPGVARSCWVHYHRYTRIGRVWPTGVRRSRGRRVHTTTLTSGKANDGWLSLADAYAIALAHERAATLVAGAADDFEDLPVTVEVCRSRTHSA